ncbi:MAG: creatininase family protein [Candidatus Bathyarchaeia archaeon]
MPVYPDWWYSKYNIFEMTAYDVAEWLKKTDICLIPVGSCEQHGPHLPINCDSLQAWIVTKWAAEKAQVLHTPVVWTGYSPHHIRPPGMGAGTITLRAKTFEALMYDISRSLIHHGFNKLIYVIGHTSNIKIIDPVLRSLKYKTGAFAAMFRADAEILPLVPEIMGPIIKNPKEDNPGWHGGEGEISMCLLYHPEAVHMERVKWDRSQIHAPKYLPQDKFTKHDGSPYVVFKGQDHMIYLPMEHHEYCDQGIIGKPTGGDPEKARRAWGVLADKLAEFIEEVKKLKVEVRNREFDDRI